MDSVCLSLWLPSPSRLSAQNLVSGSFKTLAPLGVIVLP